MIGDRIRTLRISANLTQEDLAEKLGLKKVSIQKYENGGIVNLKIETIEKLAEIFDVSPAFIMGWTDFDNNIDTNKIKSEVKLIENIGDKFGYIGVELFQIFDTLNDEGKRRLLFYAEDIKDNPKYKLL